MAQAVARPSSVRPAPEPTRTAGRGSTLALGLALAALCVLETITRLGAASPDTRYTLPQYSLGYFWDSPLGWTGVLDGTPVNRDSSQFESLAAWLRGDPTPLVPLSENVYTRFTAYALVGGLPAPVTGPYLGFVVVNVALWVLATLATRALALRRTGSPLVAALAAVLVATAPAFAALVGQALPYGASYALFVCGLWYCERIGLFSGNARWSISLLAGLAVGASLLVYDLYMLPLFVALYGARRMARARLGAFLVAAALPKLVWALYWSAAHLPRYTQNEDHPLEALRAWIDLAQRGGPGLSQLPAYAALAAHVGLNVLAAFLFLPALLAAWELLHWRQLRDLDWYLAVLVAGCAPAAFMVSTWPHIPRWYVYAFPAVYILAALGAVRLARTRRGLGPRARAALAGAVVLLLVVVANLDLAGVTRPMELFLFQPQSWSYLWPWAP
jgi:hypothetical protein